MNETPRPTALVTGASAGIGRAFAHQLARRGYDLVLTARRRERLEELANAVRIDRGVDAEVIIADLSERDAPRHLFEAVQVRGLKVDVLVNNAGYGLPGMYAKTRWEDQASAIQVLVTAVAHLTHLFLPGMIERGSGHIINVMSLAGLLPGAPGQTLYAASKSFGVKFTESLAAELLGTGVSATAVCPGLTFSEFHDVTKTRERVSRMPSAMWMDADEVAREGLDAALRGEIVCVTGRLNHAIASAAKLLPDQVARKVIRKRARSYRNID
jgi:short-subunit dehydrogenase